MKTDTMPKPEDNKTSVPNPEENPAPIEANAAVEAAPPAKDKAKYPWLAWLAVLFTVGAWLILVWVNGYAAVAVGLVAIALAITSMALNRGPLHRLCTTALVAAMVLELVVGAFLLVLKMV